MAAASQPPGASGQAAAGGCGAPAGGVAITDAGNQAIVQGTVTSGGTPVRVGYARLLNSGGDFVAEVPLGDDGGFRFFAAPGDWTLRVLAPGGIRTDRTVTAATGEIRELQVTV
jgi:hypothetical protein